MTADQPSEVLDVGERCVHCDRNTGPGSTLWVDRIPADGYLHFDADTGLRDGWACRECQEESEDDD